jgi:capsular polysaccharide biosynthesis protein
VEIDEVAARLLRRYWAILVAAVLLPVLAVGVYTLRQPPTYLAHARVVASDQIPKSAAEATAVVSEVRAYATSRDVVSRAVDASGVDRDPDAVLKQVTVSGLGSSPVAQITVGDRTASGAQKITAALASQVATSLDTNRIGGLPDALKAIDTQLTDLATKRAPLAVEAQNNSKDATAQSRLAGIDRLISDLSGDRNRLSEEAAATGHAKVVQSAHRPSGPESTGLWQRAGLAALLGLVIGLLIAAITETVRPTVPGAQRVGRLLGVPLLGKVESDPAVLADLARRVRLAARRAGAETVVLTTTSRTDLSAELVDRIEAAVLRPAPVAARVAMPVSPGGRREPEGTRDFTSVTVGNSDSITDGHRLATLSRTLDGLKTAAPELRRVCALDELDPSAEAGAIGLVVVSGAITRLTSVHAVRDMLTASGWPLLGVLAAPHRKGARR